MLTLILSVKAADQGSHWPWVSGLQWRMFASLINKDDQQDNQPKPQQTWRFPLPPAGTSFLQSRRCGQLPAGQPVQTARWSGRRRSRPFFIQAQLAVWNGQITLYCSRLSICLCRNFVKMICIVNIILSFEDCVLRHVCQFTSTDNSTEYCQCLHSKGHDLL